MSFKDFVKFHIVPRLVNYSYGTNYEVLNDSDIVRGLQYIDSFKLKQGNILKATRNSRRVPREDLVEFDITDLRPTDTVLDLGANVGGFTTYAAMKAKRVVAVEPLFYSELSENVRLNKLGNVFVIPGMLGDSIANSQSVTYDGVTEICPSFSFRWISDMIQDRIDFLKCDCEGAEIYIPHDLLLPIRRIEIELHNPMNQEACVKILDLYHFIRNHWWRTYTTTIIKGKIYTVHAFRD